MLAFFFGDTCNKNKFNNYFHLTIRFSLIYYIIFKQPPYVIKKEKEFNE